MARLLLDSVDVNIQNLGPGPAVGVWCRGCRIGCRGCMSRHTWGMAGGSWANVEVIAAWIVSAGLPYLTISGGEPFDQADAVAQLVRVVRRLRPSMAVTCYSGYTRERIEGGGVPHGPDLLCQLDLLIDGPYREDQHASLLWRGSTNQRIHQLTGRVTLPRDVSAGFAVSVDPGGRIVVIGVPARPGFAAGFEAGLPPDFVAGGDRTEFPFPIEESH